MPAKRTVKLRDLKKILSRFGITYQPGRKHPKFVSADGRLKYPIPYTKDSDDVYIAYIGPLRRKFSLIEKHGCDDGRFWGK